VLKKYTDFCFSAFNKMEYFNEALAVELESVGHPLLAEVYRECKGIPNVCFKRCDHVIVGMQRAKRDNVMRHP